MFTESVVEHPILHLRPLPLERGHPRTVRGDLRPGVFERATQAVGVVACARPGEAMPQIAALPNRSADTHARVGTRSYGAGAEDKKDTVALPNESCISNCVSRPVI